MRPAAADPERQPTHGIGPSDRISADRTVHYRSLRPEPGAERGLPWVSDSGIELQYPARLVWPSPWVGHIPFALWLVDAIRPRVVVELGVHSGNSYCAFLQAVQALSLPARCYGIDHWRGDEHSDYYPEDVYTELRRYHDAEYGAFSTLMRSTFHDALAYFSDGTVDLLHIDGFHTFEAVSNDLAEWLPKMSPRGVVLLHDINVRERDFGVWRVWEGLAARYDTVSFAHSHGLGVAYVGTDAPPPALRALLALSEAEGVSHLRSYFARLGTSLIDRFERRQAEARADRLPAAEAALEGARADARAQAEAAATLRADVGAATARAIALEGELSVSRTETARHVETVAALQQELAAARADTARHVEIVVAVQQERVALRAETARRMDEADRLRRELAARRAEGQRQVDSATALGLELAAARAETARHAEAADALQRELDVSRDEVARQLAALAASQESADAVTGRIAELEEQLARSRDQAAAALAQRERSTLLLREHIATTSALRREIAALRRQD